MRVFMLMLAVLTPLLAVDEQAAFQEVTVKTRLGKARIHYAAQSLGPLRHPVGDSIQLADVTLKIEHLEDNEIAVDYGERRPKILKKTKVLKIPVHYGDEEEKLYIEFIYDETDARWYYVNRSVLAVMLPGASAALALVDANGNGRYDDAHLDGLAWPDQQVLFPLPRSDERWALPQLEVTALQLAAPGQESSASVRALHSITPAGLAVLQGANRERARLGIIPRPEDPALTADLAKHCHWMAVNKQLSHPEKKGSPGYSPEGHAAGMRSILNMGRDPAQVAAGFMDTLYHRFDVIRADLQAFGVGSEGRYSGIDGRTTMMKQAPSQWWPILCPMPEQTGVALQFRHESPDPINGDQQAGWPITVVFAHRGATLKAHTLQRVEGGQPGPAIDCYTYDATDRFLKFSNAVGLIPKDPLQPGSVYQVMISAACKGEVWQRTWKFATR